MRNEVPGAKVAKASKQRKLGKPRSSKLVEKDGTARRAPRALFKKPYYEDKADRAPEAIHKNRKGCV